MEEEDLAFIIFYSNSELIGSFIHSELGRGVRAFFWVRELVRAIDGNLARNSAPVPL